MKATTPPSETLLAGLLVIEQSSTLSNLLVRTLSAGGYSLTTTNRDLNQSLQLILEAADSGRPFEAVILGVPPRDANAIKPVLKHLAGPDAKTIPLLLVTHDRHLLLERWSAQRGFTETIAWQSFSKIPGVLKRMLPDSLLPEAKSDRTAPRAVRVLLVDDSHSARYAYRQLLEAKGFPVEVAATIGEAKKKVEQEEFDLAIVDHFLPDGTGDQLCRHLRDSPATRRMTLAMITGGYRESIVKKCLDAGAVECLFKNEAKELFVTRVASLARTIEARQMMAAERLRLDGVLASVDDGVYGVDAGGRLSFVNPTAVRMLGYKAASELIGEVAAEVLHYHDAQDRYSRPGIDLAEYYANGEPLTAHTAKLSHSSGRPVAVECTVFPLSIQSQRMGSVVIIRPLVERRSVEQPRWEPHRSAF